LLFAHFSDFVQEFRPVSSAMLVAQGFFMVAILGAVHLLST